MRESLFRGKRLDNGEWVSSGNLITFNDEGEGKQFFIPQMNAKCTCTHDEQDNIISFDSGMFYKVDPDTVGQFTGLTDKNGKKIFEGDIVRILGDQSSADWRNVDYVALIAFIDGGFCALDGTIEDHGFRRYALARMDFDLEIIGNIHDNPELLGGEEDED